MSGENGSIMFKKDVIWTANVVVRPDDEDIALWTRDESGQHCGDNRDRSQAGDGPLKMREQEQGRQRSHSRQEHLPRFHVCCDLDSDHFSFIDGW